MVVNDDKKSFFSTFNSDNMSINKERLVKIVDSRPGVKYITPNNSISTETIVDMRKGERGSTIHTERFRGIGPADNITRMVQGSMEPREKKDDHYYKEITSQEGKHYTIERKLLRV